MRLFFVFFFFFSSRRRHTRYWRDWSSDVCSSDLTSRVASGGHHDLRHEPTREVARSSVLDQCQHLIERLGRHVDPADIERSEERRVGKEWRYRREQNN